MYCNSLRLYAYTGILCQNCRLQFNGGIFQCFHYCTDAKFVRVRFAPSPTGFMHIGGLRTALYNYLYAKSSQNGKFIVRIEDTDQNRLVTGATEHLLSTLSWAGLEPDESPVHGGDYGPYLQSERLHHYSKHAEDLIKTGSAYRCFCSSQRLKLLKRDQLLRKENPRYDNRCRNLSPNQIEENLALAKPFVVRLTLKDPIQEFNDELFGNIRHDLGAEGDPVLLKSDGYPTYHLANVVDDRLMDISHVIRGREWLVSTAKHVLLYKAFGWKPPQYMHLPLLINQDGTKLSKRQNDINIDYFKDQGYSALPLINFMVYCGSGFPNISLPVVASNQRKLLKTLCSAFKPETLLQSDATLDFTKLDEFSRIFMSQRVEQGGAKQLQETVYELFDLVLKNYGKHCIFHDHKYTATDVWNYLLSIINVRKGHINKLNDLVASEYDYLWIRPMHQHNSDSEYRDVLDDIFSYLQDLNWTSFKSNEVNKQFSAFVKSRKMHFPSTMKFLRMTLIGREEGPKVSDLMTMFGKRETLWRLSRALE